MDRRAIRGIVQKIVNGQHGLYAVATAEEVKGSITFSLEKPIWSEKGWPEKGTFVVLSELCKKRAGWRAMRARFLRPSDERR